MSDSSPSPRRSGLESDSSPSPRTRVPISVYLDFQKAFDKVSHTMLIVKMKRCGISSEILRWVGNWLTGQRQSVD